MKMAFRIECPKCYWGHSFSNDYINMGYLKGKCDHCGNIFFFKVQVMGVKIEICQDQPMDDAGPLPVNVLPEAKE